MMKNDDNEGGGEGKGKEKKKNQRARQASPSGGLTRSLLGHFGWELHRDGTQPRSPKFRDSHTHTTAPPTLVEWLRPRERRASTTGPPPRSLAPAASPLPWPGLAFILNLLSLALIIFSFLFLLPFSQTFTLFPRVCWYACRPLSGCRKSNPQSEMSKYSDAPTR